MNGQWRSPRWNGFRQQLPPRFVIDVFDGRRADLRWGQILSKRHDTKKDQYILFRDHWVGLYCLQMPKGRRLTQRKPGWRVHSRTNICAYHAFYYAVHAIYLAPDPKYWQQWYPPIRDELIGLQKPDGHWDGEAGPVYGTTMALLALSVPYRYLPVYQR